MYKRTWAFILALVLVFPYYASASQSSAVLELVYRENNTVEISLFTPVAINAVGVIVFYDPGLVWVELDTANSFCSLFIERTVDVAQGQIRVLCGHPNPGVTGRAEVARINFRQKGVDPANFALSAQSQVLANDGQGTNVIKKNAVSL